MYKRRGGQINALECPVFFEGVQLDPSNHWIKLAEMMPWDWIEREYAGSFERTTTGNPAKPARMAIGTLIIKERYGLSDEDVVEEIRMNPYLQYFIGLSKFMHKAPFDASSITRLRKRATPEMLARINDIIIGRAKAPENKPKDPSDEQLPSAGSGKGDHAAEKGNSLKAPNEGTLILDAACMPQNIRFPTDLSLLNEARESWKRRLTHYTRKA